MSYYIEDGVSNPPGASTTLSFTASDGQLEIHTDGRFNVGQPLKEITALGISERPPQLTTQNGTITTWKYDEALQWLKVSNLTIDLNGNKVIMCSRSSTAQSSASPVSSGRSDVR